MTEVLISPAAMDPESPHSTTNSMLIVARSTKAIAAPSGAHKNGAGNTGWRSPLPFDRGRSPALMPKRRSLPDRSTLLAHAVDEPLFLLPGACPARRRGSARSQLDRAVSIRLVMRTYQRKQGFSKKTGVAFFTSCTQVCDSTLDESESRMRSTQQLARVASSRQCARVHHHPAQRTARHPLAQNLSAQRIHNPHVDRPMHCCG